MTKNLFIAGTVGVGKTSLLRDVTLPKRSRIGGFYTEHLLSGKIRRGFIMRTFDGQERVLAAKGMIDARQKRGTFVQPREKWNMLDADVMRWQTAAADDPVLLDELTEVRTIVEPAAARIAAERASDEDIESLREALADMAAAGHDTDASVEADLAFHRRLMAATHNNFLLRMERVIAIGLAERDKLVHGAPAAEDPVPSHRKVFDAIVAGDPAAAEQAMLALVTKSREELAKISQTSAQR